MPIQAKHQSGAASQVRLGHDLRTLFEPGVFTDDGSLVPRHWHPLPDFRASVHEEGLELLQGRTPARTGLGSFDPFVGPFSLPSALSHSWAASFEFLRDLSPSYGDLMPILELWLEQWFTRQTQEPQSGLAKWKATSSGPSRSEVLIWRGRRIINWLAHLLPMIQAFSPKLQGKIWHALLADLARLIEPDRSFLANLASGWEPLSRRAVWTRAVAILGVSGSAPGLLRRATFDEALERVEELIAPDGMFADGSPLGTLSAAADLAMLTRVIEAEPINQRVRQALATLQRANGSLVTFNKQHGYGGLVESVLGPGRWRRSSILKTGHIGLIEAGSSRLWLRAPMGPSDIGPICEVEAQGVELISCSASGLSALMFERSVSMSDPQIRRRDEDGQALLEGRSTFEVEGHRHSCIRTMTIRHDGRQIRGEDAVFSGVNGPRVQVLGLLFDLGEGCSPVPSRDGESILIRTSARQAWRFRCPGFDTQINQSSADLSSGLSQNRRHQLVCRAKPSGTGKDTIIRWDLQLEDLI
jgi:uncharacterized heparinase superfamily protein